MNRREFVAGGIAAAAGFFTPFKNFAGEDSEIDLLLFLDWSDSMYQFFPDGRPNYLTQRDGHIAAFRDEGIRKRLVSGRVFVRVILWAGGAGEIIPIFAGRMETHEDIFQLQDAISKRIPDHSSHTGLTDHFTPLVYAESVPLAARRRIIDISTDQSIENFIIADLCRKLKGKLHRERTTINVLAIGVDKEVLKNLKENLLTPDGFIEHISSWEGYVPAIKRKIEKELGLV